MSTKFWIGLVVVIIVVLGAWYFISGPGMSGTPSDNATTTPEQTGTTPTGTTAEGTTSGSATIGGLIALGSNLECDVTVSNSGTQLEGTVYLSGGKMRSEFATTQGGTSITANTINDGTTVYVWSDKSTQGYKTSASTTGVAGAGSHGGVDSSTAVKYSCKPWAPVAGNFTPPSNIKFN